MIQDEIERLAEAIHAARYPGDRVAPPLADVDRESQSYARGLARAAFDFFSKRVSELLAANNAFEQRARDAEREVRGLKALLAQNQAAEAARLEPTHRHVARGGLYRLAGLAELQSSNPIEEGAKLAFYISEDGKALARPLSEFDDGRFVVLDEVVRRCLPGAR